MTDEAVVVDTSGSFTIPQDFIVGLSFPIHAGESVDPAKFYVKNIGAYATGFSVVIGYDADGGPVDVATALINRSTHSRNQSYALGGIGDFDDSVGRIVIGRLDSIDAQPAGFFTFSRDNTQLDMDVIRPMIRGVSSIAVISASGDTSPRMTGDIELVAGENVQLVPVVIAGQDPKIIVSAIEGEGLIEDCVCEGETEGRAITRINGIPPTATGDFTILGNECLDPEEVTNGLKLVDLCSQPCCGCEELEAITRDLELFGSKATTLENFLVRLENSVTQMDMVVLGATLRDRGCFSCD
jgi:hypothetical protein